MSFRDDTDALRAQKERLEAELKDKERELAEREREIARLKAPAEPDPPQPVQPVGSAPERPGVFERLIDIGETIGSVLGGFGAFVGVASFVLMLGAMLYGVYDCACAAPVATTAAPSAPGAVFVELTHPATVSAVEGPAPVAVGTSCVVAIASQMDEVMSCRVTVECGGTAIYGGRENTGYLHCEVAPDKTPLSGMDAYDSSQDGDPEAVLDLAHHHVEVRDGVGAGAWGVTLTLGEGSARRVGLP